VRLATNPRNASGKIATIYTTIQEQILTPSTGYIIDRLIKQGTPPISYKTLTFTYTANYASISADITNTL
jgi:hypothetical protein